jgi:hypothetical protein
MGKRGQGLFAGMFALPGASTLSAEIRAEAAKAQNPQPAD